MKKIIAFILAISSSFSIGIMSSSADVGRASVSLGFVPSGYTGIYTKADLDAVRNNLSGNYILMNDLEFTEADFASGGAFYNNGAGWQPIGDAYSTFTGTFDGNGYVIKNIYIDITDNGNHDDIYAGLFGYNKGTIKNLGMVDGSVKGTSSRNTHVGAVAGYTSSGTITECYNTGLVVGISMSSNSAYSSYSGGITGYNSKGTITNCYNTGNVTISSSIESAASRIYAGGIVGDSNSGTITNCYNTANVTATSTSSFAFAGGIAGRTSYDTIDKCYNNGGVEAEVSTFLDASAGGIAGRNNESAISNCYNAGNVTGTALSTGYAGGLLGRNSEGTLTNCYNIGNVKGTGKYEVYVGGIVGHSEGTITHCYYLDNISKGAAYGTDPCKKCTSSEMKKQATFVGFDFNSIWKINSNADYPYPTLRENPHEGNDHGGNTEIPDGYIRIYTKADLNDVRNNLSGNYILMNDIEFTDADFAIGGAFYNSGAGWYPIGDLAKPFTGIFDGNGYSIKSIYIYFEGEIGNAYEGLFGYNKGTIKNLGVVDGSVTGIVLSYGITYAGGIVGYNDGVITNCYNTADATATSLHIGGMAGGITGSNAGTIADCHNTGSISANTDAGGITGGNVDGGEITNCYNTGNVMVTATSKSSGYKRFAGGVVGYNNGEITNCYNTGNTTSPYSSYFTSYSGGIVGESDYGTITNCYNTGDVDGPYAGGIAGRTSYGEIADCHNTGSISANYGAAGGIVGDNDDSGGLVGDNVDGGEITNCYNTGDVYVTDGSFAGGIVGNNSGTITNCYNTGDVDGPDVGGISGHNSGTIADCHNTGSISANYGAGGITGSNHGTITNCYNTGNVTISSSIESAAPRIYAGGIAGESHFCAITNCYNTGDVSASSSDFPAYAGGIAGINHGCEITNGYNTGSVTATSSYPYAGGIAGANQGGEITNCYNTGDVSASSSDFVAYAGGIVGDSEEYGIATDYSITNCYYLDNIPKGVGDGTDTCTKCTSSEMKKQVTFGGFDFKNIWFISSENYKYPQLKENPHKGYVSPASIAVTTKPNKLTYIEGESFSKTGMVVTAYYSDGSNEAVTDYTVSGYTSTPGTKTIIVTYDGKIATFTVTVKAKELSSIAVTTFPKKMLYFVGKDAFDPTGGKVTLYYSNNTTEEIDLTNGMVSGFSNKTVGTKTLTVTYKGKTTTFNVTVDDIEVTSIAVTTKPNKLIYVEGEPFDRSGMVVTVYFSDNTSAVITDYNVSCDTSTPGAKTVTISYNGKTATFKIDVTEKSLTSIVVTTKPNKRTYIEGELFNKTGLVVTAYYNNGTSEVITDYTVSGYTSTIGPKTITVAYRGMTDTFTVDVIAVDESASSEPPVSDIESILPSTADKIDNSNEGFAWWWLVVGGGAILILGFVIGKVRKRK